MHDVEKKVEETLAHIQDNLLKKAREFLKSNIVEVNGINSLADAIKNKKMTKVQFCGSTKCEDLIKEKADGATCRCIPFEQKTANGRCVQCGEPAKFWALFGKNY